MKAIGSTLAVIGILVLIYGLFIQDDETVLQVGSMEISASEDRSLPVPVIVGGILLLGGGAFLVYGGRRSRAG